MNFKLFIVFSLALCLSSLCFAQDAVATASGSVDGAVVGFLDKLTALVQDQIGTIAFLSGGIIDLCLRLWKTTNPLCLV